MSNTAKRPPKQQDGLISITVAIVFIMIISLIVLGFSQVSRRNARQSLDRQLSAQAYYAAESGINDVVYDVSKKLESGQDISPQNSCSGVYTKDGGKIKGMAGVKYTCLKVKTQLSELRYSQVSSPVVVPLNAEGGAGILNTNEIVWTRQANPPASADVRNCPAKHSHPQGSTWAERCPFGLLRVDIMPATPGAAGTLGNPQVAAAKTMTLFLHPRYATSGTATVPYDSGLPDAYGGTVTQGAVADARCDENTCRATITGLNFPNAFMRLQSVYVSSASLQLKAAAGVTLTDAQIEIDVTGKSQDTLRNINVRYPLVGSSRADTPNFAANTLQSSGSICKYFSVYPGYHDVKDSRCQ